MAGLRNEQKQRRPQQSFVEDRMLGLAENQWKVVSWKPEKKAVSLRVESLTKPEEECNTLHLAING